MSLASRLRGLFLLLAMAVAVKTGVEIYRWAAYGEERAALAVLREGVLDAGADLIRFRLSADSLQALVSEEDRELEQRRRALERYDAYARDGALPIHLYEAYREEVAEYNRMVEHRNTIQARWTGVRRAWEEAETRYHWLSDSIRRTAARMGEPYPSVPTPAEAAIARGVPSPEP